MATEKRSPSPLQTPGIYVEEGTDGSRPIVAVGTSTAGFIGTAPAHPQQSGSSSTPPQAELVTSWTQFKRLYFPDATNPAPDWTHLAHAVYGFFLNGGRDCWVADIGANTDVNNLKAGLEALGAVDEIAVVAAPGLTSNDHYKAIRDHVDAIGDRLAILDPPRDKAVGATGTEVHRWVTAAAPSSPQATISSTNAVELLPKLNDNIDPSNPTLPKGTEVTIVQTQQKGGADWHEIEDGVGKKGWVADSDLSIMPTSTLPKSQNGQVTMYFPWIEVSHPNPGKDQATGLTIVGQTEQVPPSGHIAGIWARSDAERGVHKAPANEQIRGALSLTYRASNSELGTLNNEGVNALRYFRDSGYMVWGARTLTTDPEWRYVNVRRLFNMIKKSISESTRWIVFEANDETLWSVIRRDLDAFLTDLWHQGALAGSTPQEAFFVKCDAENNPPEKIRMGTVVIDMGIAPVRPAEFIIFRIGQYEAGTEVEIA